MEFYTAFKKSEIDLYTLVRKDLQYTLLSDIDTEVFNIFPFV